MEIEQKKLVFKYLIDKVFMSQVNVELQKFLNEYDKITLLKIHYKITTGYEIGQEKPVILNLDKPLSNLLNNILITLGNENKIEKKEISGRN